MFSPLLKAQVEQQPWPELWLWMLAQLVPLPRSRLRLASVPPLVLLLQLLVLWLLALLQVQQVVAPQPWEQAVPVPVQQLRSAAFVGFLVVALVQRPVAQVVVPQHRKASSHWQQPQGLSGAPAALERQALPLV